MPFSIKQQEFIAGMKEGHRWNIKTGATRSGKTHMDYYVIPKRIRACTGTGLIVLIGNTVGTLTRNIIEPMRNIWGDELVGSYSTQRGTIRLFGRDAFLLGADNKTAVKRLQGSGIEYCYGDELTTWNEEVFSMLKSRLDKPNSVFDGTCNPADPNHFIRKFLLSDADIFSQQYTLDDNPFLSDDFKTALKKEYAGTVYYDRFILGKWVAAEGVIYQLYAADPGAFDIAEKAVPTERIERINVGVDFGGTKSGTAFVATAFTTDYENVIVLKSRKFNMTLDPPHLNKVFDEFCREIIQDYGWIDCAYCDSAESILIKGMRLFVGETGLPVTIHEAAKNPINSRIRLTSALISQNRLKIVEGNETIRTALSEALWNDKKNEDERLDDGTTDIDTLDAFEYSIEREARRLLDYAS